MSTQNYLDNPITFTNSGKLFQSATSGSSVRVADTPNDLLTFLGIAQGLNIDLLPISWDTDQAKVGEGGSAEIEQSPIDVERSFAFKRLASAQVALSEAKEKVYKALIAELCVLGHKSIRGHSFVTKLQGICWDIDTESESVWPVLVFEKTPHGDLERFMNWGAGAKIALNDRLRLCTEVAIAITDLHMNCIVHGDIKPANILIFEDRPRHYVARVADFGYSTWFGGADDLIYMPRSLPWTAPEWHHRAFNRANAFKMDVYSFGLLCLWLLFYHGHETRHSRFYEDLKSGEAKSTLAHRLIDESSDFSDEQRKKLRQLFDLSLTIDPAVRCSNFEQLRAVLAPDVISQCPIIETLESDRNVFLKDFRVIPSMIPLYQSHYLVRANIATCLEERAFRSFTSEFAPQHAAFELSFCYTLGFGVRKDDTKASALLKQAAMSLRDLLNEVNRARKSSSRSPPRGSLYSQTFQRGHINPATAGLHGFKDEKLNDVASWLRKEIVDVEGVLGIEHLVIGIMKSTLAHVLIVHKKWEMAQEVETEVLRWSSKTLGDSHPDTLISRGSLASILRQRQNWEEAEALQTQALITSLLELGLDDAITMSNMEDLVLTFKDQGKWERAERLAKQALQIRKLEYGSEHRGTKNMLIILSSINDDNVIYERMKKDAVQRENSCYSLQVGKRRKVLEPPKTWQEKLNRNQESERILLGRLKVTEAELGRDHPLNLDTLISLAIAYQDQQRWKEAESIVTEVVAIREKKDSQHGLLIRDMIRLTSIYNAQGRWKEAEDMQLRMIDARPDTERDATEYLFLLSHLASTYSRQGRLKEAEALELQIVEGYTEHFDRDHHLTVGSMKALSSLYTRQGRWGEAETLALEVVNSRKASLEPDSPALLMCIDNLVTVYMGQKRWEEAGDLEVPVLDKLKGLRGEHHPSTLKAMDNVAEIWYAREKRTEALSLMSKVVRLSETTLGPSHPYTIGRKQTSNEWLCEANHLLSKGDEYEEDGTSRDLHEVGDSRTETVIRASQESTESTRNFDSSGATAVTVVHNKSFSEAEKGKKRRRYIYEKIASYERGLAKTQDGPSERYKLRVQLLKELLLEYAVDWKIECE